jgi:5-carboxymethyl-2-hydroxymuconate isomerase
VPHIILKTSEISHNAHTVLSELVDVLCRFETVKSESVKAYWQPADVWVMGAGAPLGFAHCEVCLLSGREVPLRQQIADEMFATMLNLFAEQDLSITVEIREMDKEAYRKT